VVHLRAEFIVAKMGHRAKRDPLPQSRNANP